MRPNDFLFVLLAAAAAPSASLAALLPAGHDAAADADADVSSSSSSSSWLRSFWTSLTDPSQRVLSSSSSSSVTTSSSSSRQRPNGTIGYVAFGDSYSAGIGTGFDGKEDPCRLGQGAYPALIAADLAEHAVPVPPIARTGPDGGGGANDSVAFQWLSCTGSTTDDLLAGGASSQIDDFNRSSGGGAGTDLATLSIGGNDLGFFDVINACVFRFYSFYSGTCEAALNRSAEAVASPAFEERLVVALLQILDKVQWEKRPWFVITVTGYARFFNADHALPCDESSMGVWWGGPRLTQDLRVRMNALVMSVNTKLQTAIAAVNLRFARPKVFFVDFDREFEGHRFCEPNVTEPDYARDATWFFLIGGPDTGQNGTFPNGTFPTSTASSALPGPTAGAAVLDAWSPLVDPDACLEPAQRSGDWGELAVCYMAMAKRRDPSLRLASSQFTAQNSMWYVPTYYGKTFHPVSAVSAEPPNLYRGSYMANTYGEQRSDGHKVMRDKIYDTWQKYSI